MLAPDDEEHFGVPLDAMLLAQAEPQLADAVVKHPKATLDALEQAAYAAQVRPRPAVGRQAWGRADCSSWQRAGAGPSASQAMARSGTMLSVMLLLQRTQRPPTAPLPCTDPTWPPAPIQQEAIMAHHPSRDAMSLKPQAHIRLHSLPYSLDPKPHALNPTIGRIGSSHIGRLISVAGTVVKTGPVKMFEHQRLMRCNKCTHL